MMNDGCFDCSNIDDDCTECGLDGSSDLICTDCRFGKMLSPNSLTCVQRLEGCKIETERQPADLEDAAGVKYISTDSDGVQSWFCPACRDGWYWDNEEKECTVCNEAMDHCNKCVNENRCTDC
jgi:hypothetical protein